MLNAADHALRTVERDGFEGPVQAFFLPTWLVVLLVVGVVVATALAASRRRRRR